MSKLVSVGLPLMRALVGFVRLCFMGGFLLWRAGGRGEMAELHSEQA